MLHVYEQRRISTKITGNPSADGMITLGWVLGNLIMLIER